MILTRSVKFWNFLSRSVIGVGDFALLGLLLALISTGASAEIPRSGIVLGSQQFANELAWSTRVDLNARWESETQAEGQLRPLRELWFQSFFEPGHEGDKSFEMDVAVVRLATGERGHLWFGRSHPWLEDGIGSRRTMPDTTGAVGSLWSQNQARALQPRVVGWIGAGWSGTTDSGVSVTALMSPIYLPSFGPRVDFSETAAAQGSRFAKLPPAYLLNSGNLIPVRYRIETGDLTKVVLQHQLYLSTGWSTNGIGVRAFAWSAPTPSPKIEATGKLRVNSDLDELNAVVTATPSFPRETNLGVQWELGARKISDLQITYQLESRRLTFSTELRPVSWLRAGLLHGIDLKKDAPVAESPVPAAQRYSDGLVWAEFSAHWVRDHIQSLVRFEHHVTNEREGLWIQPELRYSTDGRLGIYALASLIAGKSGSYFGQWRSLDSVGTGVSYQW